MDGGGFLSNFRMGNSKQDDILELLKFSLKMWGREVAKFIFRAENNSEKFGLPHFHRRYADIYVSVYLHKVR